MEDEELCSEYEKNFHRDFYRMSDMVEKLFADYEKRVEKKEKKKKYKGEDNALVNQENGEDPLEPPYPSSISISSSSSSHSHHSSFHPHASKKPLLKLDVKFNFPMFNTLLEPRV
jgi:hypothetical protein